MDFRLHIWGTHQAPKIAKGELSGGLIPWHWPGELAALCCLPGLPVYWVKEWVSVCREVEFGYLWTFSAVFLSMRAAWCQKELNTKRLRQGKAQPGESPYLWDGGHLWQCYKVVHSFQYLSRPESPAPELVKWELSFLLPLLFSLPSVQLQVRNCSKLTGIGKVKHEAGKWKSHPLSWHTWEREMVFSSFGWRI